MRGAPSAGATVWITGLPAAGKSTLAAAAAKALEARGRRTLVLDGDVLRRTLSADLSLSRDGRREQARRASYIACLAARCGFVALVSLVSPYREDRDEARDLHATATVPFLEAWVATSLVTCRRRDPKGLYAAAESGALEGLTGVDDPYEPPHRAELVVQEEWSPSEAAEAVVRLVENAADRAWR